MLEGVLHEGVLSDGEEGSSLSGEMIMTSSSLYAAPGGVEGGRGGLENTTTSNESGIRTD